MVAVRQKVGPAMSRVLATFKLGETRRRAPCGADAPQGFAVIRFVNDDVVLVPRTASWIGCLRKNGNWSARGRHFFQVAIGKKAHEFAVGGPKRKDGPLRAFQLLRLQ